MIESLPEQIIRKIEEVAVLYHRLVLLVGPPGSGKTQALEAAAGQTQFPYVNLNLELSRRLLDLTERQRTMQVSRLLGEIVKGYESATVLLDHTEILFDPALKQNPLSLLQGLSRNYTIVAAWHGAAERGHLTYARPDHPEYRRYPLRDLVVISSAAVS